MKKCQEHIKKKIYIYILDFNTFQEMNISMTRQRPKQMGPGREGILLK